MTVTYAWRAPFDGAEVERLHAEGFGHAVEGYDWRAQVERHSLGWVCARDGDALVGWVNVAWDGAVHAFILDTLVDVTARRRGIGKHLVAEAVERARAAGCEWLHVDFEPELTAFYVASCGFESTPAGVIALTAGQPRDPTPGEPPR